MSSSTLEELLTQLTAVHETGSELLLETLDQFGSRAGVGIHIAVMTGPYLDKVLSGAKTVESRLTKNRSAPYGRISAGDVVLFKHASGPIGAVAVVGEAICTEIGNGRSLGDVTSDFAEGLAYESDYLESKSDARYCSLIVLENVRSTPMVKLRKRDRQTWVTVGRRRHSTPSLFQASTTRVGPTSRLDGAVAPMWILVSGAIASGKTSVARAVGQFLDQDVWSFGDVIRSEASRLGLPRTRGDLQELGASLHDQLGPRGLADLLLDQASGPAVIEGIRHVSVLCALRERCVPSLAVFVDASTASRDDRFASRSRLGDSASTLEVASGHSVESEVALLRSASDFIVDSDSLDPASAALAIVRRISLSAPASEDTHEASSTQPSELRTTGASVGSISIMATKSVEDGIRAYLDSLGKPNKPVVDREAVKALKDQIKTESDPIVKLRLHAQLELEQQGKLEDHDGDKAVFVAEAKGWADAEGIPVSAFQALKIPDEVLREAGFDVSVSARPPSGSGGSSGRAPRVPLEDVKAAAAKLGASWRLSDLAEALDRDAATVRNYVNKLVDEGSVSIIGDDPNHDGRGRAPKLYSSSVR